MSMVPTYHTRNRGCTWYYPNKYTNTHNHVRPRRPAPASTALVVDLVVVVVGRERVLAAARHVFGEMQEEERRRLRRRRRPFLSLPPARPPAG